MKTRIQMPALRKQIEKDFGTACRDFVWGCPVCVVHVGLSIVEDAYDIHVLPVPKKRKLINARKMES